MLTQPHHSASALDFKRGALDFDVHKERIEEFFNELGFEVRTRLWGGPAEHTITVVHRRKEDDEGTDFGFSDLEKAVYVVCVILKEQQESPISEDIVMDHLARKKDEDFRLVIRKKDIGPTLARLEERGVLVKVGEGVYDWGWNWDVFFDPATILGRLEKSIEYDQRYRPRMQSKVADQGGEGSRNETETG